jgi:hypothetical protein
VDGDLIAGQHPGVVEDFMTVFVQELDRRSATKRRSP